MTLFLSHRLAARAACACPRAVVGPPGVAGAEAVRDPAALAPPRPRRPRPAPALTPPLTAIRHAVNLSPPASRSDHAGFATPHGFRTRCKPFPPRWHARSPPPSPTRSAPAPPRSKPPSRSEEHTSELQSLMRISYAVFCLK